MRTPPRSEGGDRSEFRHGDPEVRYRGYCSRDDGTAADPRQFRARREASRRLPPLDCGCADPLGCRCYERPPAGKIILAAEHLIALGFAPLFSTDTIRALWPRDRELALGLARLAGVTA